MLIRLTQEQDLAQIDAIFNLGRQKQQSEGNFSQWINNYPNLEIVRQDIAEGTAWVCVDEKDGMVLGTWALGDHEEVYNQLKEGQWSANTEYKVIHRLGTLYGRGVGKFILRHLQQQYPYLRTDTFEKNPTMLALLAKLGFKRCGIAYYEGYGDMIAFDYIRPEPATAN